MATLVFVPYEHSTTGNMGTLCVKETINSFSSAVGIVHTAEAANRVYPTQGENMQAIKATETMLESLKQAVKATEVAWDSMRDLELEVGKEFNNLDEFVRDLSVVGAESVTLEMLQEFLDEQQFEDEGDND